MRLITYLATAAVAFVAGVLISGPIRHLTDDGREAGVPVQSGANFSEDLESRFFLNGQEYPLTVLPGVFTPREAQQVVLPLLDQHPEVYQGKIVLEIGAGSGINVVYMALGGAAKVVATDISTQAIANIRLNAETLGVADIVDARLVPPSDISAYAVIGPDERFDLIISNPPYHLDLDTTQNTPTNDTGELGFSIVDGFPSHLQPDGLSLLFYNSLFYHELMVKYARYRGYDVSNHFATGVSTREAQVLFNYYLARILAKENLPADAFRFERGEGGLQNRYLRNVAIDPNTFEYEPLIRGSGTPTFFPGWMAIRNP